MWKDKTVSVALMTYAERDSIREVIEGFFATGLVDEVLVVDNNAELGTREEVERTRARLVHEPRQGYGSATRRGLTEARGDLIVLAEPDGTFLPEDLTTSCSVHGRRGS
jgi:glycosyltransferase involved in cell wall biosynthesis